VPSCERNGVTLYYEQAGAGPGVLFISGTGGDLRNKPSVFDGPFARSFDVLAYDQRGLGQSSVPAGPYSMADYADDAAGLLAAVGWEASLVVGVSFGGMVAQELALRHGSLVRRLVLACTSSGGAGGASYPLHELAELGPEARAIRQLGLLDTRWDSVYRQAHPVQWHAMVDGFRAYSEKGNGDPSSDRARGAARQLEARRHHDTADRLGSITCPTLVCGGRFDGIAPPANSEFLAGAIAQSELALFDGGHQFLLQDPAAIPAVLEFLGRES
jgi:3-oxoadipate enol-lactonase